MTEPPGLFRGSTEDRAELYLHFFAGVAGILMLWTVFQPTPSTGVTLMHRGLALASAVLFFAASFGIRYYRRALALLTIPVASVPLWLQAFTPGRTDSLAIILVVAVPSSALWFWRRLGSRPGS